MIMETRYIVFWAWIAIMLIVFFLTKKEAITEFEDNNFKEEIPKSDYPTTLREWLAYTKKKNLSIEELKFLILNGQDCDYKNVYLNLKGGHTAQKKAEYLHKQWNTPRKPRIKKPTTNIE